MLAIRMQRTGRKGHAMFRVVVQESRLTPSSGRVVAQLGHYDPHAKTTSLVKDKAEFYLSHGAQPSDRVVRLFEKEGVSLPKWIAKPSKHTRTIRNLDKLRRNRPVEEPQAEAAPAAEAPAEATPTPEEATSTETAETPAPEATPESKAPAAEDQK